MNSIAHINVPAKPVFYPVSSVNERQEIRKAIKVKALSFLARREHSRLELLRKLSQKYSDMDTINSVLTELQEQGYQSDDRYAEMLVRSKVRMGYGPFRVKIDLREKGVCESTALSVLDRQMIDWFDVAKLTMQKRFGDKTNTFSEDEKIKQLSKQARYLKNKGFYQEHIDCLIKI